MTALATRTLTLDEFLAGPEEPPWQEYLRGEITEKPMPTELHGFVGGEIFTEISLHLRRTHEGKAAFEVRHADRSQQWVYLPDIHVRLFRPGDGPVHARGAVEQAPDFVVEVLSPDDRASRWLERVGLYLAAGTSLLWVVDPEEERVYVYRPGAEPRSFVRGSVIDAEPVLKGFTLDLGAVFDAAKRSHP